MRMSQTPGVEASLGEGLSRWVLGARAHARGVVLAFLLTTFGALYYTAGHLGIHADQETLFNQELPFRRADS